MSPKNSTYLRLTGPSCTCENVISSASCVLLIPTISSWKYKVYGFDHPSGVTVTIRTSAVQFRAMKMRLNV